MIFKFYSAITDNSIHTINQAIRIFEIFQGNTSNPELHIQPSDSMSFENFADYKTMRPRDY
ncbi:MAG: hypothetical protein IKT84_05735 [Bacteroidales bacterium]|nr:hypothetical protein [Bacteroidales bacterium]